MTEEKVILPQQGETQEILDLDEDYPEDRCACGAHLYTETEYGQGWCFECVDNAGPKSVGSRITEGFLQHDEDAD